MPTDTQITDRLNFAVEIAREAGEVTLNYFRREDLAVERKADRSPVTIADRSAEELLRKRIGQRFPDDGIIGEEFGTNEGMSGLKWTLDPIDGTKSFVHGVPLYTTLIAVLQGDEPIIGVVHAPATGETVFAAKGGGCWYATSADAAPRPARVSSVAQLSESLLLTTEIEEFRRRKSGDTFDSYARLQRATRLARTWGDGYGYLLVATGRAEIMIDPVLNVWDAGPMQTIVEEAGGKFTDWKGTPTIHAGEALATNGLVTDEVLAILRS